MCRFEHEFTFCIVVAVLCAIGCDVHDFVPDASDISDTTQPWSAFVSEGSDITGLYGNLDVDSRIFAFNTDEAASVFWKRITDRAKHEGWSECGKDGENIRCFERLKSPTTLDSVHVAYSQHDKTVVVGWISLDNPKGLEEDFAKGFWSRFAGFVERSK